MLTCPKCAKPLAELPSAGTVDVVCAGCRFKFQLVLGTLISKTSQPITRRDGFAQSGLHDREYELRVELPNRELELFNFTAPGSEDWIRVEPGDSVGLIHTMRGSAREELLSVVNYTTGKSHNVAKPGSKTAIRAAWLAVGAVTLTFVGSAALGASAVLGLGAMVTAGLGTYAGVRWRFRPIHRIPPHQHAELEAGQSLLERKQKYGEAAKRARAECADRELLRTRLANLQQKMRDVALPAYESRIASLSTALEMLDEQIKLDRRVVAEYERLIKILEIEYEAGVAAAAISDDPPDVLRERLDELTALESHRADLGRQLAANAEVEQALKTPST